MQKRSVYGIMVVAFALLTGWIGRGAEATWNYAVQVSASVDASQPKIVLSWPQDTVTAPNSYTVYRKTLEGTSWGNGVTLSGATTSYTDTSVQAGTVYEYQIYKVTSTHTGYGYIAVGVNAPIVERRGKVVLVVDASQASALSAELTRLQADLVGDGWTVVRQDVQRTDSPANVKNAIKAAYNADPSNVKAVFLFGHVPVPYSGNIVPDGHSPDHLGAWPADVYYGDMDGNWTDNSVYSTGAYESRNYNVPGDGKFDQSYLPSPVELQVGRVDLANMPGRKVWGGPATFPNETELLRQYLNKDNAFRHKKFSPPGRALVHDSFGGRGGEGFAASAFRSYAPFFGANNIQSVESGLFINTLANNQYLCAYGCGGGSYASIVGLGTVGPYNEGNTVQVVEGDIKAVFTMLMGSWLGDWDSEDNIMRAVLATRTMGLSCAWSGRPHWFFHHMGMGETLGYSTRITQNNGSDGLYKNQINSAAGSIHVALMGDPTLRLHPVAPVSGLQATSSGASVNLAWSGSSDNIVGYHVYRASSAAGPFTRVTTSPITQTTFSDSSANAGANTYMVRAVKLENTPSGSYYNQSQGIFASATSTGGGGGTNTNTPPGSAPVVSITAPGNNATVSGSAVTLSANATDNTGIAGVQFKLDGMNLGAEDTASPYSIVWNSTTVQNGSHTLTAVARDTEGNQTTSSAVILSVNNAASGGGGSATGTAWVDDSLPTGALPATDGGDLWNWVTANPTPTSGTKAHQSGSAAGLHQHYFDWASATLDVGVGDVLYAYIYLDPASPPTEVMLQWNDGTWEHRAYWGANRISYGIDGTVSRKYVGPLPAAGQWARLEVPAKDVALESKKLKGMSFTLFDGRATWDNAGKSAPGAGGSNPPPSDFTPPTIAISAPANNATVSGAAVQITASATDNVGVTGVQFKLNGQNLQAEDITAPFGITWNTSGTTNGMYTLTAVARDAAGNQKNSSPITVLVSNTSSNTNTNGSGTNSIPATDSRWFDDALPAGAVSAIDGNDSWNWASTSPAPFSGAKTHQSSASAGLHQHYFDWTTETLSVNAGEVLYAYVYLDPANPPSQIMLQWNDGTWEHRAFWGANKIPYGVTDTETRRNMGALPAAGSWVRLAVAAKDVGLEGKKLKGMAFSLFDGRATWDVTGKSTSLTGGGGGGSTPPTNSVDTTAPTVAISQPANNATINPGSITVTATAADNVAVTGVQFRLDGVNLGAEDTTAPYTLVWEATAAIAGTHALTAVARDAAGNQTASAAVTVTLSSPSTPTMTDAIWVEDAIPTGGVPAATGPDTWNWTSANPTPFSGSVAHQSALSAGLHQHYFDWASQTIDVAVGDSLYAYVFIDPANPPSELMLQWNDGSWEHRAYWGASKISYGYEGTESRRSMGALPAAGQWVRLEVPAKSVGLEGKKLKGMAFSCFDGRATWDSAGKASVSQAGSSPTEVPTVTVEATIDNADEENATAAGEFTFTRVGNLANPTTILYTLTGTAINGIDYRFPASVTIASGASSTNVALVTLNDALLDDAETVVLTLTANAAYKVGPANQGTVVIYDTDKTSGSTNSVPGGTNSIPAGTNAGPEISVTDYTGLRLPKPGDATLHVLSPTLLELQLVNTKQPDPAPVTTWDFVDANNQFKAPAVSEFNVKIDGANASVQGVGFKRRVLYAPVAARDLRIQNSLYLKLSQPINENQSVEVLNPSGALWASSTKFQTKAERLRFNPAIHVNQEGYVPAFSKKAMVGYYTGNLGEMDIPTTGGFQIVNANSGAQVYQGTLKQRTDVGFNYTPVPYQKVWEADFSALKTPGEYRLVVPGMGASLPFLIDEGIAMDFTRAYALGLYHQRCGTDNVLPHTRHEHGKCHTAAADVPLPQSSYQFTWNTIAGKTADYANNPRHTAPRMVSEATQLYPIVNRGKLETSGGHHDAGDYSKYTVNSASFVHYLIFAVDSLPGVADLDNLGLPNSGDGISDILQEAKWEADYLAKIQDADGGFYFLVYPRDREYEWGVTPDNGDPQVVWPKTTAVTAAAVAALAQAASSPKFKAQYPTEAAQYLTKAKLGWKFLTDAIAKYGKDGSYQKITHYGDAFMHDDELAWAACQMFLATGDETYHTTLKQWFDPSNPDTFRWGWWRLNEAYGNAVRSYAFAARSGRLAVSKLDSAYLAKCEQQVVLCAQDQLKRSSDTAYGSSFPLETKAIRTAGWYFSSERAFDLTVGYQIDPRQEFIDCIIANMNYEGGCNPVNVSYVTGLGWKRQRDVVNQYALADRRALPPTGIPVGNITGFFQFQDNYKQELNSLDFPDDDAASAPYPLYDRWGDSWNVYAEFVILDQARSLASLAFLSTMTATKSQPWKSGTATIVVPPRIEIGKPTTVMVQAPGMDLNGARIVWEARDQEPGFGASYSITPQSSGTHWIEAEVQWPDGRRVFASTTTIADGGTAIWVDDDVPTGAIMGYEVEPWSWASSNPSPNTGSRAHQSPAFPALHQHWFSAAKSTLEVFPGDKLFAYIYIDPANPPSEIMLQWNDGSWEHRAYWGANTINQGVNGTDSRRYVGPLPAAGQWVKLEVPAGQVGLEGKVLNGMAFGLYGGKAAWDTAGRSPQ